MKKTTSVLVDSVDTGSLLRSHCYLYLDQLVPLNAVVFYTWVIV